MVIQMRSICAMCHVPCSMFHVSCVMCLALMIGSNLCNNGFTYGYHVAINCNYLVYVSVLVYLPLRNLYTSESSYIPLISSSIAVHLVCSLLFLWWLR